MYQAPYYTEKDRGLIPEFDNKFNVASWKGWLTYDPIFRAEKQDKPVLLVASEAMAIPDGTRQYLAKAGDNVKVPWLDNVSQFDFYDVPAPVKAASDAVADFFFQQKGETGKAISKDEAKISLIIQSMGTLADQGQFEKLGQIFADTVTIDYTSAFGGKANTVKRDDLMTQWAGLLPGFDVTYHDLSTITVKQDGDKATASADVTASHFIGNDGFWEISGSYDYTLQKVGDRWQITSLTLNAGDEKGSRDVLGLATEASAKKAGQRSVRLNKIIADGVEINRKNLWPKPENPVAKGSEENNNLKVVQGFFDAYGKHDMEALKKYVAEDVEWHIPGHHKNAGTKRGIKEFFDKLGQAGLHSQIATGFKFRFQ